MKTSTLPTILFFIMFGVNVNSQVVNNSLINEKLSVFLKHDAGHDSSEIFSDWNKLVERIDKNLKGNSLRGLRRIYRFIAQKNLKEYSQYSTLTETLKQGKYDCVTATILISTYLQSRGFSFQIFETTHHLYIMAYVDGKEILIETTDPIQGFYTNDHLIENMVNRYHEDGAIGKDGEFKFKPIHKVIEYDDLVNLYIFNKAVAFYNEKKFNTAYSTLNMVNDQKDSRFSEFRGLLNFFIARQEQTSSN